MHNKLSFMIQGGDFTKGIGGDKNNIFYIVNFSIQSYPIFAQVESSGDYDIYFSIILFF